VRATVAAALMRGKPASVPLDPRLVRMDRRCMDCSSPVPPFSFIYMIQ